MRYANISIERGFISAASRIKKMESDRVINVGDYMQLLAIDDIYREIGIPEEDIVRIDYYDLWDYDGEDVVLPINFIYFNPYYGERQLIFSKKIHPVFLGIHCLNHFLTKEELDYLRQFEPIGCRNEETCRYLQGEGIDAYLQGCLTSVFPGRESGNYDKIFLVDIPDSLESYLPEEIRKNGIRMSHQYYGNIEKMIEGTRYPSIREFARQRLQTYKNNAGLVVTSRLHCASPCAALGIPVIFAVDNFVGTYAWLERICSAYVKGQYASIDWKPKPADYEKYKSLIRSIAKEKISGKSPDRSMINELDQWYEARNKIHYSDFNLSGLERFAEKNWKKGEAFRYGIWGITECSESVYQWISQHYPDAKLQLVIDEFRDLEFHGIPSCRAETLSQYPEMYVVATGNSSCIAAQKKFDEENRSKYLCRVFGTKAEDAEKIHI